MFMSFEESIPDLTKNVASLGFDLDRLVAEKKLFVDYVSITRSEFGETGEYDLEGLFIRIADAVDRVGARRVVLDTVEALFGELPNAGIVRSEIRRLFNWLKQNGLTTVITAERDQADRLTRHGIEEFVSDCVILLDHRIREEISTRRLRIEIPGIHARHQRVSVPDRRPGHFGASHFLTGAAPRCTRGTGIQRHRPIGRHVGRQGLLLGEQHSGIGHGGDR